MTLLSRLIPGTDQGVFLLDLAGGSRYLRIDPATGSHKLQTKLRQPAIAGWFTQRDGHTWMFFRRGERLLFACDNDVRELSEETSTGWNFDPETEHAQFSIAEPGKPLLSCRYPVTVPMLDRDNPDYVPGEDDFFFCVHRAVSQRDSWPERFRG